MSEPTPRRILMTADTLGGVWTYALEMAHALAPHGVEIALATMGNPLTDAQRAELAACANVELFESRFQLEWMDDPWADVDRASDWLLEVAASFEPDLVHLNGYAHSALPWSAPVLIAAHSCVLSWWNAVKGGEAPARYDEYQCRVAAGLAAAKVVVAPTSSMMEALRTHYCALPRRRVVFNSRTSGGFPHRTRKQPRVITAGRLWDEAKNVATLDAVAPSVGWPIHVAGDRTSPDGARAPLRNVCGLGKLTPPEMAAQLAASAIYALPARYEPFGLSALEAGLCGCALVLGDIPSLREVWGDAALFVAPDDAPALAQTLNGLIDDPTHLRDFGRRARKRALQYSPQKMGDGYLAVYRACLGQQEEAVA